MWNKIKQFLAAPTFKLDEEKTFTARILNTVLVILIVGSVIFELAASTLLGEFIGPLVRTLLWILLISLVGLKILLQRGFVQLVGILLSLIWWALFTLGAYSFGGLHDTAITGFFFLLILASTVTQRRIFLSISGLTLVSIIFMFIAEQTGWITPAINIPTLPDDLVLLLLLISVSAAVLRANVNQLKRAYTETNTIAQRLSRTNMQLETSRGILTEQARQLEQRTQYLEASAAIAQEANKELNLNILLPRVTTLISEAFNFYHVGIYLLDANRQTATLMAASSAGGRQMVANQQRVDTDAPSLIGEVLKSGLPRAVRGSTSENPALPDTRSATMLPLRARDEIIGVLDVQSDAPDTFNEETSNILQSLSEQVAIAVQTAQLFAQLEESIAAERRAFSTLSQEAWKELLQTETRYGYQYTQGRVSPIKKSAAATPPEQPAISIPIKIAGLTVGSLEAQKSKAEANWSEAETTLLTTLAEQLSVALENARLYQDTQKRAAQEQIAGEVTTRIRETLDIETILRTASKEIQQALDLTEVVIQLGSPETAEPAHRS